jgi:uncharacterized Zn ribbon protein
LTLGTVLEREADKIKVQNLSTPAYSWTSIWREIEEPKKLGLQDGLGKTFDCRGNVLEEGDAVIYLDELELKDGVIGKIDTELWVDIDGKKFRNVSVYKKN